MINYFDPVGGKDRKGKEETGRGRRKKERKER